MKKEQYKIKGKTIEVLLETNYEFGDGFRTYVERGLDNGFKYGAFKSKAKGCTVGIWNMKESWTDKYLYMISNFNIR